MGQYLIDNNAISHFFSGQFSENGMKFISEIIDERPIISVITQIEALSWINADKAKESIVKSFVQDAIILELTNDIIKKCVSLKRSRKIKKPDAIIAATAIVHNITLITSDKDFSAIPDLKILDPFTLS